MELAGKTCENAKKGWFIRNPSLPMTHFYPCTVSRQGDSYLSALLLCMLFSFQSVLYLSILCVMFLIYQQGRNKTACLTNKCHFFNRRRESSVKSAAPVFAGDENKNLQTPAWHRNSVCTTPTVYIPLYLQMAKGTFYSHSCHSKPK